MQAVLALTMGACIPLLGLRVPVAPVQPGCACLWESSAVHVCEPGLCNCVMMASLQH